jgi:hypothetical protein
MGQRRSFVRTPRRRRNTSGDAALGIVIIGGIAVAALGVYVVIVGVVALVGWLVAIAARREARSPAPQLVAAAAPSAAMPPASPYHVVLPVEPGAFDAPRRLEEAVTSMFCAWARQLPKAPSDPRETLRGLDLRKRLIGRLTTKLDGRRFAWRAAPYTGRERTIRGTPIEPAGLDPYNPPSDLRTRSQYLDLCRRCGGGGRIECVACGGASRLTCVACAGAGKVHGLTANGARRLLNCKTCKGKATSPCAGCTKGQRDCPSCARSGRIEHWLEVEGGPRDGDIQVEPDGNVTRAFPWGKDGVPASDEEIRKDARVVCTVSKDRLLATEDLPREVSDDWRRAHWQAIQPRLQPGERVISQTFALLEVPAVEATYVVGSESQSIEFEGLRLLAPPISADAVFHGRATALGRLAIALAALPLVAGIVYAARGTYFHNAHVLGVVLCAAIAAAVIYGVFWHATLWGGARRWLALAIPPIAAATALAIITEPSAGAARNFIDRGQLELAEAELNALGDPTDGDLAPLWADVYLKRALATKTCTAASELVAKIAASAPQRATARAYADSLAMTEAERALADGSPAAAAASLGCADEALRSGATGRQVHARIQGAIANNCLAARDWSCVFARAADIDSDGETGRATALRDAARAAIRADADASMRAARTEEDLARRIELRRTAIDLWTRHLLAGPGEPAELAALKSAVATDQRALDRQNEAARRRQIAEERRRAAEETRKRQAQAREDRRRLAEEERRERQRMPRSVRCCDGTLSPSCMCGASLRGCCSHHGGVCGCE